MAKLLALLNRESRYIPKRLLARLEKLEMDEALYFFE
jgi:hypothetical protein